jgi:hypothetical protein
MEPIITQERLAGFFAWAPLVLGLVIYAAYFVAKRHEFATTAATFGTTYACSTCGRRGAKEHMLPQTHDGAISYVCSKCAGAH